MKFLFKETNLVDWKEKEIIWGGGCEGVYSTNNWKDVFGKVLDFTQRKSNKPVGPGEFDSPDIVEIVVRSYDDNRTYTYTEESFNRIVNQFELLTPALKNFSNEVEKLLSGYKVLTIEEKRKIINLYLE
jgi:hypothetical protein